MCIGGRLGMVLDIESAAAFSEVNGCLLVELPAEKAAAFEKQFSQLPYAQIGQVTSEPVLKIGNEAISVADLAHAFNNPKHL